MSKNLETRYIRLGVHLSNGEIQNHIIDKIMYPDAYWEYKQEHSWSGGWHPAQLTIVFQFVTEQTLPRRYVYNLSQVLGVRVECSDEPFHATIDDIS